MNEKGEISITLLLIPLVAILMFVIPMILVARNTEEVAKMLAQEETTDIVDEIRVNGEIDGERVDKYFSTLASTGNVYDVEIEVRISDENVGKKTIQASYKKIGENGTYSIYDDQVFDKIFPEDGVYGTLDLNEGDSVSFKVYKTSSSPSDIVMDFVFRQPGDEGELVAEHSGMVTGN